MNYLIIGSGGREHAICWKLAQSEKAENIYCIPGNYGISLEKKCHIHKLNNIDFESKESMEELFNFIEEKKIDLTIVGPEKPLVNGVVDEFQKRELKIFGPDRYASQLEGSKEFAKKFMNKFQVRTAGYVSFDKYNEALDYLKSLNSYPVVIKADGLAAGKGVFICRDFSQALVALNECMKKSKFGKAGDRILVEKYLDGVEMSILAVTDGKKMIPFVSSKDHKKLLDGDKGPNTGGMGVISPNPVMNEAVYDDFMKNCLLPTLNGIQTMKMNYKGILFFGLMIKEEKCYVLEYNVRMGDPETQSLLPLLKTDLVEIFEKTLDDDLDSLSIDWLNEFSTTVVMASGGYPGEYEKGFEISFDESNKDKSTKIFFSGVSKSDNGKMVTDGGRVLSVTSIDKNKLNSIKKSYERINNIKFKGAFYRKDIGINTEE